MTPEPSGPITLSKTTFLYTAATLLVVLPIIVGLVFSPVLYNYWCAQFEIPDYGRRFGFTMGRMHFTDLDGKTHSELAITSMDPAGVFARAGIRVGDVPRMQHGSSSLCAALAAASKGYKISLSVLNVEDSRAGQDKRREITIDLATQRLIGGTATLCGWGVACAAALLLPGAEIAESAPPPRPVYGASTVCSADFITGEATRTPPILVVHVVNVFGEPLADTALTLRQPARDGAIKKMTTAAGRALFEDARVGGAELVVERRGFAWVQVREITLQRGCTTAVTIPLVVADVVD